MSGQKPRTEPAEMQIPSSLASFATKAGISFKQAVMLLEMQQQIRRTETPRRRTGWTTSTGRSFTRL